MKLDNKATSGLLLAIASAQFITAMMLGEAIAPGYSMHDNAISDLGTIDETRVLFGASLFIAGLLNLLGGLYFYRVHKNRLLMIVFALGGIGAMGAGLVPLDAKIGLHGLFALMAFLFISIEAILSGLKVDVPLRVISVVMGVTGIVFTGVMFLVDSGSIDVSGGIGHGGTERMIAYPVLVWMMIYGGYLLGSPRLTDEK